MEAEYEVLLYQIQFRRFEAPQTLSELRAEVSLFLKEKEDPLLEHLERKDFIHGLAYPAGIINHTNKTNLQNSRS
jgi:hypothetical protein